jgi:NAD(P)-dependent dehydrogenase (short-subunit alcohol dehydrogenase family)
VALKSIPDLFDLSGKVAIVTGAGLPEGLSSTPAAASGSRSGLGFEIAKRLTEAGASVVVNDIEEKRAVEAVEHLEALGRKAIAAPADVTDRAQIEGMLAATLDAFGRVDILINNAAIYPDMDFLDITEEHWNSVMQVDVLGPVLCSQIVAKQLIEQGEGGSIVNVLSTAVMLVMPSGQMAYSVAKEALRHATPIMARVLAPHSIRVNSLIPGAMAKRGKDHPQWDLKGTPLTDGGLDPDQQARGVLFLVSDLGENITGIELPINGGMHLLFQPHGTPAYAFSGATS